MISHSGKSVLRAQSAYYVVTGAWPLIHYDSFERVTGRKHERWLVETVGGLIATAGICVAVASREDRPSAEGIVTSAGSALTLGLIDALYLARGRLAPAYALDLVAQAAFLARLGRLK